MLTKIRELCGLPHFDDPEKNLQARSLSTLFLAILVSSLIILPIMMFIFTNFTVVYIIIGMNLWLFGAFRLARRGHIDWAATLVVISLLGIVTYILYLESGIHDIASVIYPVLLLIASLLLNRRSFTVMTLLTIICTGVLVFGEMWQWFVPKPFSVELLWADFLIEATILGIAAITVRWLVDQLLRSLRQARRELVERRRIEGERESLIKELEAKNTELERFTDTVSHDLRSPLITIRSFLNYLEQDLLSSDLERVKHDIAYLTEATTKMERLIDNLLKLSRVGRFSNPPEDVAFHVIVDEALSLLQGRLTAHNVEVTLESNLPHVYGDHVRLVQVIQNLLDNAVKFLGNQEEPSIEIGLTGDGDERVFYIRDNGVGIAPHNQEKSLMCLNA